ncbi:MAG: PGN_0703 family putative restriction endonuclease [Candidatus Thorarchaeota archaeon]
MVGKFAHAGIAWPIGEVTAEFEYDDRTVFNEDSGQPTSIDLVVTGENKGIFVEAKLVEREFGGCSVFSGGDCDGRNPISSGLEGCYLHHIGRKYWDRMKEFGFGESAFASGHICPFINYYQFFREVLLSLTKGGSFILLHDERNPAFLKTSKNGKESGLWPFLMESIPAEHTGSIARVPIQQLVNAIDESGCHHDWIDEFKLKYGIE